MKIKRRTIAWMTLIGVLLAGLATIIHPVIYNPWDGEEAMQKMFQTDPLRWTFDHAVLIVGVLLWLGGFTELEKKLLPASRIAGTFCLTAMSLWILFLASELTAVPYLMQMFSKAPGLTLQSVIIALFSFNLFTGYLTIALIWAGLFLFGSCLKKKEKYPSLLADWAMLGGAIGTVGSIYAAMFPEKFGLTVLLLTTAIPYLWSIVFPIYIIRAESQSRTEQ
ncbi:hypothetical protein EWI07_04085 [Sporolactobacillus sp. THM7-4]|nr:hypothetical protein EWI07_04085 [Sporolactobacillus sp. THM7-4]